MIQGKKIKKKFIALPVYAIDIPSWGGF